MSSIHALRVIVLGTSLVVACTSKTPSTETPDADVEPTDTGVEPTDAGDEPPPDGTTEDTGGPVVEDLCPAVVAARHPEGGAWEVGLTLLLEGEAITGDDLVTADGTTYSFTELLLFVSALELEAEGVRTPVDLLDRDGNLLPYGVHLVDLADEDTWTWKVRAPVGTYDAVRFEVGLPGACFTTNPGTRVPPLHGGGAMHWPWFGYFHLRMDGFTAEGSEELRAFKAHGGPMMMPDAGVVPDGKRVRAAGELRLDEESARLELRLDLTTVIEAGAAPDLDHIDAGVAALAALPEDALSLAP